MAIEQWTEGRAETLEVLLSGRRLIKEGKVLSATGPRLIKRLKHFAEAERPVVQCEAASGAVVAVEIALAIADSDPVCDQRGKAAAERLCKHDDFCGSCDRLVNDPAVLPINQVQHQLFELFDRSRVLLFSGPATKEFKLANPDEGRRNAGGNGNRLRNELVGIPGM